MTTAPSKPGLPLFFPVEIPTSWTPEQALAVFNLLTEIRDKIWDQYNLVIQLELHNQLQSDDET
jgi:hypothetical protein